MADNTPRIRFRDHLPAVFQADEDDGISFLSTFLKAFEALFEELEGEIEGTADRSRGGIPDLFNPELTPPEQFKHHGQANALDFLDYLASWIALPIRVDLVRKRPLKDGVYTEESDEEYDRRRTQWNREFFRRALQLQANRGTLPGLNDLLRAWLTGDLRDHYLPLVTDLTPDINDEVPIFQLDRSATLDVDTVLDEAPPYFFVVDLDIDPKVRELRTPAGLDTVQRAARALLEAEKPAYTSYQLRVHAPSMRLAPSAEAPIAGELYAQLGDTTLLWDTPWVFDSDR